MHFVSEHFALCIYKIKMINSLKDPHSVPTRRSSDLQGGMPRDDAGQGALSGGHGAKRAVWPRGGCAAAGKARCAAVGGAGCSVPWHESADRSRAAEIFGHDEVRQII